MDGIRRLAYVLGRLSRTHTGLLISGLPFTI